VSTGDRQSRAAAVVFGVAVAVAAVMYVRIGARNWFFLDEWDFLAARSLTSARDLLEPHNEHWSTLPIIAYRLQYGLFGLRSYVPYVIAVVALHLAAATLLRAVMRNASVGPWLATAAAGLFLFLGSGFSDIIWGFQIGFTGSLAFGLAHLLLSDHDGPFDRRDWLGLACGLAGVMCSGVAVTMVGVVGLSVLVRRGWRMAALHTVPLGVAFVGWWLAFGSDAESRTRPDASTLLRFVRTAIGNALRSVGQFDVVTIALVGVLVVGAVLTVLDRRRPDAPRSFAPWALVAGAFAFACITGMGRAADLGVDSAKASRYVHLIGAMTIPAIAVAAQAIARRWSWTWPLLVVLLLAGIPGNIDEVATRDTFEEKLLRGNPTYVRALAEAAATTPVAGRLEPDRFELPGVTAGWLREAFRDDRIELVRPVTAKEAKLARTRLVLEQREVPRPGEDCEALRDRATIRLGRDERLTFDGRVDVRLVTDGRGGPWTQFNSAVGQELVAQDPVTVELRRPGALPVVKLCR
jgi:hypothetical protein